MGELFKKYSWLKLVVATLLLAAGILIFILAIMDIEALQTAFSIIAAVILFFAGALTIFAGLFLEERAFFSGTFAYAAFVIAIGVLLCIAPGLLSEVIILFFGILLCVVGGTALIKGIVSVIYKDKKSWIIAAFIVAAVAITLGILLLVFNAEAGLRVFLFIVLSIIVFGIGVLVLIDGIKKLSSKDNSSKE